MHALLRTVKALLPKTSQAPLQAEEAADLVAQPASLTQYNAYTVQPCGAGNALVADGRISSRSQALHAMDAVCAYLEFAEPTNPAQLLLKRARRLIDKNFLELMKELAPDALNDVAKIMGVNPGDLNNKDL